MYEDARSMLELIEAVEVNDAYQPRTWTRDDPAYGIGISAGRQQRAKRNSPEYRKAVRETARLIDRVRSGELGDHWLREAMSTSDFSVLFGDIIDRQMLGVYAETPQTFRQIMRMGTVRDFRTVKRFAVDGGDNTLDEVLELAPYKASSLAATPYSVAVKKYGRRMPFSFEAMINDDMQALTDTPARFARAGRRSEQRFATGIYVSASGPNTTIYAAGNKNQIIPANGALATNPPLSEAGLVDAFNVMGKMRDSGGEPIVIPVAILEIPLELEITALKILNASMIEIGTDASGQRIMTDNWLRGKLKVVVNPYLSVINTTSGPTAWYIHAPSNEGRYAFEFDYIRGYEAPQLFMKSPNAIRVGGGAVDPMQGDFDHDALDYKVRHMFGGGPLDPKMTLASKGTGV